MVIISEETAPEDFKCFWEKKYSRGRGFKSKKKTGKNVTEKLFIHEKLFNENKDKIKDIYKIIKQTNKKSKKSKRSKRR